ncbi:MAG TPA: rhodanese-like domain-containing protein [Ectothiorhodospiraceae bacterium]|nr:rhodanese-like domain-containing protein [Ectothiorhodospiraceae bacterium]
MMSSINEVNGDELHSMITNDDVVLVDVRSHAEVAQGAIPGASHLPLHLLPLQLNQLPRDKKVVFYCRTGARSAQACLYAANQGSENVINLRGGIVAWLREGRDVAKSA